MLWGCILSICSFFFKFQKLYCIVFPRCKLRVRAEQLVKRLLRLTASGKYNKYHAGLDTVDEN